ncbi:MAG: AI-2E family transporter [archaeon]|nr:AI-2E family transporter [archaeon]
MEKGVKKVSAVVLVGILVVLSFLILRPIIMALIAGVLLGFIFLPFYNKIKKRVSNKSVAAWMVCLIVILAILIPIWFLTPVLLKQSIQIFSVSQQIDFITPIKSIFPSLFASEEISAEITTVISSFVTRVTSGAMNLLANFLTNIPTLSLQFLVVLFVFFFVLRDNEKFALYIKSLLPFSKEVENKLFKSSEEITSSIIYGQIVVGGLQGVLVGIGFFLFGVPNALFLTILAIAAGILPIIGATVIWIPVIAYLFFKGDLIAVWGVSLFGIAGALFENVVKPMFISKKTNVHPGVILLGMIGGVFFFGFLGFILGPIILSYLLIILEVYRDKNSPGVFIQNRSS